MANYFCVMEGGSATGNNGRHESQPTGPFEASTSYHHIEECWTVSAYDPVPGDYILVADNYTDNAASGANVFIGSASEVPISIISVDVNNRDIEKAGAKPLGYGTAGDFTLSGHTSSWYIQGMHFVTPGNAFEPDKSKKGSKFSRGGKCAS